MKKLKKLDPEKTLAYIRGLNRRSLKYRIINRLPRPSTVQLFYRIDIYDPKGKLYKTTGDQPSHSFVKAFLQLLELMMANAWESAPDTVSIVDTGGSNRNSSFNIGQYHTRLWVCEAPAGNDDYGILVGTGTTPPATDDNNMETVIVHGTGSGQLSYSACAVGQATEIGANMDLQITRSFINGSGDTVSITECGLAVRHSIIGTSTYYFLIIHDAADQDVPDGYTAYVTYTIRTTV
jgi:hypothetical protein